MSKLTDLAPTMRELYEMHENHRALVMAAMAGENYKELAFNFGLPIGTVKSRLSRVTAKLLENRKNAATDNINP